MRRRFKCNPKWITVRHPARCAEPNCQTDISAGERAFYYPNDKALYGTCCGHAETAERHFNAHPGSMKTDSNQAGRGVSDGHL